VEYVEFSPRFFRPMINECCGVMLSLVTGGAEVADPLKHLALEWLVSLAETKATLARKARPTNHGGSFVQAVFQVHHSLTHARRVG
jgi:hypothetical protein